MKWFSVFLFWLVTTTSHALNIIIGTTANSPPFASTADGGQHFLGFEVDIMNSICQRLKATCTYKTVIASNVINELTLNNINIALAAIIIPAVPLNGFAFSLPYLQSNARFMTKKSAQINSPQDIKDKRVGVRKGTLEGGNMFKNVVLSIYNNAVTVKEYSTMMDLIAALENDEIDVIFSNAAFIEYWSLNNANLFKLIGSKIPIGNGYGAMAKQINAPLIKLMNQALLNMEADGSYLDIYKRYFTFS